MAQDNDRLISLTERDWRLFDDRPNEWVWMKRVSKRHDLSRWIEVRLPASVQQSLLEAGIIPDPYADLNSRAAEWTEHRDWIYGLDFDLAPPEPGRRVFIEFDVVDDHCHIYLNGEKVGEHEGPGAPFSLEIGPYLRDGGNQLLVVVDAVPYEQPQIGRTDLTRSMKGRLGYAWDFAPRLISTGIMGDVRLRFTGASRLRHLWARPTLTNDRKDASIALRVEVDEAEVGVKFLVLRDGQVVAETIAQPSDGVARASVAIPDPQLWWPNGLGEQPLYTAVAEIMDGSDRVETTFGLRDIRWVRPPGAPDEQWPLILQVNGRRIFQKGWNWVPADSMGGKRAEDLMLPLLEMARAANVNIIRTWGGADPETAAFYDACDRLGLLVWQEFPLSSSGMSNVPPSDPDYLERVEKFAAEVVAARRNHPSLAVWGGGNELRGEDGKPLTLDNEYARRLRDAVARSDPDRDFRPSSPLGPQPDPYPEMKGELWDVHGPWEYSQRFPGAQYWRVNDIDPVLHSELGLSGEASLQAQARFLAPEQRSRELDSPARRHHAIWWEHRDTVEKVFGPEPSDELGVLGSQWLQAEGLRYYIEETRRRWPRSGGIFPWMFNEPWPMVVCTSAVEYGNTPKLAYYAVGQAYRPTVATAHYEGLKLAPGDPLSVEIWTLNDGAAHSANLSVQLHDSSGNELAQPIKQLVQLAENSSAKQLDLEFPLPADFHGLIILEVDLNGVTSRYLFSNIQEAHLRQALDHPDLLGTMFDAI